MIFQNGYYLEHTDRICLTAVFSGGLLAEDKNTNGMTHLLEHLHFRGNETLPQPKLYREMELLGAAFSGMTTAQTMSFSFTCQKEAFLKAFDLFCLFLFSSFPKQADFKRERAVVCREIEEEAGTRDFEERFKRFLFGGTPLALPIGGIPSRIRRFSRKGLLARRELIETDENAVFFLSGAVEHPSLYERVKTELSAGFSRAGFHGKKIPVLPRFSLPARGCRVISPRWDDESELGFALFFPRERCDYFTFELFRSALCGGDGSVLFRELRERDALCTDVDTRIYFHEDFFILTFSCIVKKEAVSLALDDVGRALCYMKKDFRADDLEQSGSDYRRWFQKYEEDPDDWNELLLDLYEATGNASYAKEEIRKGFAAVTAEKVRAAAAAAINMENISVFAEMVTDVRLKAFLRHLEADD
ncbi:MAG: M16 family metallopeptidase [Bacillota bacterium]|jgi:predicted Zn-dependent peptidase